jgi:histidyl-tRNA synthetase
MARAYLEHQLYTFDPVAKLYCIGPMFRYERPQKGRYRQFYQIDAEVFGVENPMVDAEVIVMLIHFLKRVGLEKLELQINSLGCRACRPRYREELKEFLTRKSFQLCEDCQRRLQTNPLRIFDCKVETCQEAIANAPKVTDFICPECHKHFNQVKKYLEMAELPYILNPRMVRGLDYYTRTAFEVVSYQLGSQNAVTGGGRYDNLFQEIGGLDVPGIGFAIGMERLASLLNVSGGQNIPAPRVFIAVLGEAAGEQGFSLVNGLRSKGIWTEIGYTGNSLKSQMRRADRLSAEYVLIIGDEEIASGKCKWKRLKDGSQGEISFSEVNDFFR